MIFNMKNFAFLFPIFFAASVVAQPICDLVVYTTEPEPFFLILNGVKQNQEAMTNVRVTDLNQPMYDARVVFEGSNIQVNKKIFFGDMGMEYVYKIKAKRNGELTLRPQTATALNLAPPPPSNQQVVVYHSTPAPALIPVPVQQSVTTTTTTSTTSQSNSMNNGGGINMSLGIPGMNVNMNLNDPFLSTPQGSATYTESVTTTTTSSPALEPVYEPVYQPDHYVMPGYNGSIGCPWPMDENQFANAKRSVESKSFDDAKMTVAKQITGSNCLTADQVRRMMLEMSFESAKLEYAKFAYNKTYDIGNYYVLNDAFDFSSSVDELNEHINYH